MRQLSQNEVHCIQAICLWERQTVSFLFLFKIFILYWNIVNNAVFISGIQQSDSVIHRKVSQFRSVQSLSRVRLFGTPRTAVHQASLSITNSRSLLKLMSIEFMLPSNHLILYHPLLLPASTFPSTRVFSNETGLLIRWPKYWSFSFSIILLINTQDWFPLGWTGWISLQSKGLSRVFSNTTVQKHQFFSTRLSL